MNRALSAVRQTLYIFVHAPGTLTAARRPSHSNAEVVSVFGDGDKDRSGGFGTRAARLGRGKDPG
jgi:hypothetical protein